MDQLRPITNDDKLYIPRWCAEDTIPGVKDLEINNDDFYVCSLDDLSYTEYRKMRKMTYFACVWFPHLIKHDIPTIPSILMSSTMLDLREDLKDCWIGDSRKFVRTCGSSPKDVIDVPIFNNPGKAADALMMSQRTLNVMHNYSHCGKTHLFVRDVKRIDNECRCFVHQRKLRAVSMYNYVTKPQRKAIEDSIIDFCEIYADELPYNSCILELGMNIDDESSPFPFVIEFNSYGIDGFADASLFDWDKEYPTLYYADTPEFRYPNHFSE